MTVSRQAGRQRAKAAAGGRARRRGVWHSALLALWAALVLALPVAGPARAQVPLPPLPALEIVNESGATIREVYVAETRTPPASGNGWGEDRLGSELLPSGRSLGVQLSRDCLVHLRVVFEDDRTEERRGIDACVAAGRRQVFAAAAAAQRPAGAATAERRPGEATLVNRSGRTIGAVFLAVPGASAWGENRLSGGPVAAGARATLRFDQDRSCAQDVRVVYDNEGAEERRRVDLCAAGALVVQPGWVAAETMAPADQVALRLRNTSRRTMMELYIRAQGSSGWGRDRLGSGMVSAGQEFAVAMQGEGCLFDLRATFSGGSRLEREGLDLCTLSELALAPAASGRSVTLVNRTGRDIMALYLARPGSSARGPDRLGADIINRDARYELELPEGEGCTFDMTLDFGRRPQDVRRGLDLCASRELVLEAQAGADGTPGGAPSGAQGGGDKPGSAAAGPEPQLSGPRKGGGDGGRQGAAPPGGDKPGSAAAGPEPQLSGPRKGGGDGGRQGAAPPGGDKPGEAAGGPEPPPLAPRKGDLPGPGQRDTRDARPPPAPSEQARPSAPATPAPAQPAPQQAQPAPAPAQPPQQAQPAQPTPAPAPAAREAGVVNNGRLPIVELYLSPDGAAGWGSDRLGQSVLQPGASHALRLPGASRCRFDLRAVFRDGRAVERQGVDLCAQPRFAFE